MTVARSAALAAPPRSAMTWSCTPVPAPVTELTNASGPAWRKLARCGCSADRRKPTLARFAVAGISARAGMLSSRTGPPSRSILGRTSLRRWRAVSCGPARAGHREPGGPYRGDMRVHVVSDVHGRADALAEAGRGADALICLGDLLLFLDYADSGRGIFAALFRPGPTRVYVDVRNPPRS